MATSTEEEACVSHACETTEQDYQVSADQSASVLPNLFRHVLTCPVEDTVECGAEVSVSSLTHWSV